MYIIGIDKLVDVLEVVKDVINWKSLGLQLGLLYPTLEKIENDNRGQVESCMREMIAAWLKQQDDVPKKGTPSPSVLKAALRKIGENQIADQLSLTSDGTDSFTETVKQKRHKRGNSNYV